MSAAEMRAERWVRAASAAQVRDTGSLVIHLEGQTIGLFADGDRLFAVDNRCPHMGFPLHRGTVGDCILTCHWHQARFDLASGGTFDLWADDVRSFPVRLQEGDVWLDMTPREDPRTYHIKRLDNGLERNISLILAKSAIAIMSHEVDPVEPFRTGLEFGTRNRQSGWGSGLTMHVCFMNLLPYLEVEDRPKALYHGLSAVARDTAGMAPRFIVRPLPTRDADFATLKRWFRQFIEVRDSEGAERCVVTAIRSGADHRQMAEMLFAAATDHRYIQTGHPLDFINKAFEALDTAGWGHAEAVLTSLVSNIAGASRMEESNSWRHPIDLIALLDTAFQSLPRVLANEAKSPSAIQDHQQLIPVLLGEDPKQTVGSMLKALESGCSVVTLGGIVAYCAALRIARFHTSNEFGDWDRALHTFTFANAVHQGLQRSATPELLRGVFDAAMSLYLDRFLNVPPARLPAFEGNETGADLLELLPSMLNRQQQVNEAGSLVARYLDTGGSPDSLLAELGRLLLREDRDFHTIQMMEAAFNQYAQHRGTAEGTNILIAAARYLAAHSPTVRSQGQTYHIASRLHRGERLFEDA